MARWGRTTDIEWIYRVTLAPGGSVESAVYHGPNHETLPFTGAHEGDHPLLQTATSNNNLVQVTDERLVDNLRFFLDTRRTLPAGRAREAAMDAEPWTYQVMAREIVREGRVEPRPDPATPEVSDQRNYLFAEVDKDTRYGTPPASGSWVGTALEVLVGRPLVRLAPRRADVVDPARRPGRDHDRAAAGNDGGRRRRGQGRRRPGRHTARRTGGST